MRTKGGKLILNQWVCLRKSLHCKGSAWLVTLCVTLRAGFGWIAAWVLVRKVGRMARVDAGESAARGAGGGGGSGRRGWVQV